MSFETGNGGLIRRSVSAFGPVGALFGLLAAIEMSIMAPIEDLLSPRVWWAVLLTHAVVALGVVLASVAAVAVAGLRRAVADWGLALAALIAGFAHAWPVVKGALEAAVGRPLALLVLASGLAALYWLLRRRGGLTAWQLVLPMVCFLAAPLGYYLLRARPLGLPAQSMAVSFSGIALFVIVAAAVVRGPRRYRNALLAGLLGVMVLWVRLSAPAPHAPVVAGSDAGAEQELGAREIGASALPDGASVILVVVDTLRADALDLDGGPDGRTPHLARLAAGSEVFTRAVANASWTLPSHASLFTGLRVSRHRVDMTSTPGYASKLDGSLSTLHERFAERGYATSCITANGIVGPASGLTRGCARYRHPGRAWTLQTAPLRLWYALTPSARPALEEQLLTQVTGLRRHATAAEVLGFALADLDLAPAPSYLFLNLMDVHKPYPAAPEISTARTLSFLVDLGGVLVGLREPEDFDRRQATWARRSYHEQVARLDEELGRFFAALREREIYDEALIVVTADHGEAFFDNPDLDLYYDHHGAYEAAVRIPLIVKRPRGSVGRRHARLVELADIAPAVLALAAGEPASGRLFTSGGPAVTEWNPHPVPGAMSTLPLQRIGLYRDGYKLVLEGDWRNTPSTQLFDLEQEPFEAAEVSTSEADVAGRLRDELFGILGREWAAGAANRGGDGEPDPELLETLRSLGYIE